MELPNPWRGGGGQGENQRSLLEGFLVAPIVILRPVAGVGLGLEFGDVG